MRFAALTALGAWLALSAAGEAIKTPVWLTDPHAWPAVSVDGDAAPVTAVQGPDDHLILLIVMDTVRLPDRKSVAQDALVAKLRELGPKYYAGVLTAPDGLRVVQDPVRGRKRLKEKLDSVEVRGVPGLLDVVEQVAGIADQTLAADVRVAVLFVTDGEIEDYRGDYTIPVVNPSDSSDLSRRFRGQLIQERVRSISDRLEAAQAPLFFLHLARQYDDLNEVYQNGINEFAQVTGGSAMFARGVVEIPAMVDLLLDEIAAHSVLTLDADCSGAQKIAFEPPAMVSKHRPMLYCAPAGS